jgi:c-di-GMP-related signal transduction protein
MQAQNTTQQSPTVFIARQPIFDASGSLWGHELLFRDSPSGPARIGDPDAATASVIADGYAIASETIPGVTPLLINFPEGLLLSGAAEVLPPDRCIPEILETVQPTPELVEALHTLKRTGYRLAVDDFAGQDQALPLLGLADIIKVDVLAVPQAELHAVTVDPGLTYRLLRYINSAWFALLKEVTSVQHAASLLGFETLRKWLLVITLADTAGSAAPAEAMRSAVTRARFLELLCGVTRTCAHAPEAMFLLGLLSQLDALLGIAMPGLLAHLPLDADFRAALSGEPSPMHDELRLAVLLERGAWAEAMPLMARLGFSPMDVARSSVDAQVWASRILS